MTPPLTHKHRREGKASSHGTSSHPTPTRPRKGGQSQPGKKRVPNPQPQPLAGEGEGGLDRGGGDWGALGGGGGGGGGAQQAHDHIYLYDGTYINSPHSPSSTSSRLKACDPSMANKTRGPKKQVMQPGQLQQSSYLRQTVSPQLTTYT